MADSNGTANATANQIAAQLGETRSIPLEQIKRIIEVMGEEKALGLLQETLDIEAGDGIMVSNGKRRRTVGGVFFYLARKQVTPKERRYIWPQVKRSNITPLAWEERLELIAKIWLEKSLAATC